MLNWSWLVCTLGFVAFANTLAAESPLHQNVDDAVKAKHSGPLAPRSSDAEFHRRAWLDFAGMTPTAEETREFLGDSAPDKRAKLINSLLDGPHFATRMRHLFSVTLLERRVGRTIADADWDKYLEDSFRAGKPLDQLVRELISADGTDANTRPAMKFFLSRSATDHRLLARDVSRLLLGRNLECAQCHNHPSIDDFPQSEFFGLVAFLNRSYLFQDKKTKQSFFAEKGVSPKLEFTSVFTAKTGSTGPRLVNGTEVMVPVFKAGEELASEASEGTPPIPKFPLRPKMAAQLTDNRAFARNMANRIWAMLMGRGLVNPLDMHHPANPPSHPKLMDQLTDELIASKFNLKHMLRQIALSDTYQRSSQIGESADKVPATSFAAFPMRPLSAEQLAYSVLRISGRLDQVRAAPADLAATAKYRPDKGHSIPSENIDNVLKLFCSIYASQPGESEDGFNPSLAAALFVANEELLLGWLKPTKNSLASKLLDIDDKQLPDELYLAVLSRPASNDEQLAVREFVGTHPEGRAIAIQEMAWALLASSEFRFNH